MEIESIICDGCGKELIVNDMYPHKFCLELNVIDTQRNTSGMTYCVQQYPPFEGKKHFCNNKCLSGWINKDNE
jgi:hypothetical protein